MVTTDRVIERLKQFDHIPTDGDLPQIEFELETILNYVKNYCNITIIPDILDNRIIDRVCSAYLFNKKNTGTLSNFNYDLVITKITEGDTSIQYASGQGEDTPENRFDSFVKQLERGFDKWITPHRRLRW